MNNEIQGLRKLLGFSLNCGVHLVLPDVNSAHEVADAAHEPGEAAVEFHDPL